jgi:cysteinyl-tRNA synthetase
MLKNYHPEVLRLFLLQSHYRSPVDFSEEALAEARLGMERFYNTLKLIKEAQTGYPAMDGMSPESLSGKDRAVHEKLMALPVQFIEAMDDDFNTARVFGHLFETVRLINAYAADRQGQTAGSPETAFILERAATILRELGQVLGLFLVDPDDYLCEDRDREAAKKGLNVREIESLIADRMAARISKDWKKADGIRQILSARKVILKDAPTGTTWKIE